jgi:phosphate transport system permease protein
MSPAFLTTAVLLLALAAFFMGRSRALRTAGGSIRALHSLPGYYGWYAALWCALPSLFVVLIWVLFQPGIVERIVISELPAEVQNLAPERLGLVMNDIRNRANGDITSAARDASTVVQAAERMVQLRTIGYTALFGLGVSIAVGGLAWARRRISPDLRSRNSVERVVNLLLILGSVIAIITTIGIVFSLLFEALRFFHLINPINFLFGTEWSPQTALRADQVGATGLFGILPLMAGTALITLIAMMVAAPVGLMSAIYLSDYANDHVRAWFKPLLEILAGIPTVVYGFFAAITVAPFFRGAGEALGLDVASESALAAGVVMGVMIIPFVSSLSDDVINAVPQSLRDGSYGLGATKSETIRRVILPAALPGIFAAMLLAVSRAIGETMIVVMAAGLAANLTANPLEAVTTVTVQIVTLLVGDQEFDSAKTLAAFALGLVLFCATLAMNVMALHVVRKYREQYD